MKDGGMRIHYAPALHRYEGALRGFTLYDRHVLFIFFFSHCFFAADSFGGFHSDEFVVGRFAWIDGITCSTSSGKDQSIVSPTVLSVRSALRDALKEFSVTMSCTFPSKFLFNFICAQTERSDG